LSVLSTVNNFSLAALDPSAMQDNWKVTDQFLLAEAEAVLSHRATSTR